MPIRLRFSKNVIELSLGHSYACLEGDKWSKYINLMCPILAEPIPIHIRFVAQKKKC
jgi:hypothetical protein